MHVTMRRIFQNLSGRSSSRRLAAFRYSAASAYLSAIDTHHFAVCVRAVVYKAVHTPAQQQIIGHFTEKIRRIPDKKLSWFLVFIAKRLLWSSGNYTPGGYHTSHHHIRGRARAASKLHTERWARMETRQGKRRYIHTIGVAQSAGPPLRCSCGIHSVHDTILFTATISYTRELICICSEYNISPQHAYVAVWFYRCQGLPSAQTPGVAETWYRPAFGESSLPY